MILRQAQDEREFADSAHGEPVEPLREGKMTSANTPTGIAGAELFRGLSKAELDRLERVAHHRHYDAGALIVQEGQGGIAFFVVINGQARVTRASSDGQQVELRKIGPGGVFG